LLRRSLLYVIFISLLVVAGLTGLIAGYKIAESEQTTFISTQTQIFTTSIPSTATIVEIYPPLITVSGLIQTTGNGTSATQIVFATSTVTFSSNVTSGRYSVNLLYGNYSVTVFASSSENPSVDGPVSLGSFLLQSPTRTAIGKNWTAVTPDAIVNVFGMVSSNSGNTPVQITFQDEENSINFTATISNGHYSLNLPNYNNYVVSMSYNTSQICEPLPNAFTVIIPAGESDSVPSDWSC